MCGSIGAVLVVSSEVPVFIICLTHANVWESMGKPCSCTQFIKCRIFYSKSRENPYQVLQVTCAAYDHAMKSEVRMINYYHHSTELYWKKYHSFVAVGIVTRAVHS